MQRTRWFAASALAAMSLVALAACVPPPSGGGGTTTTTTTTIPPADPNGRYVTATGADTGDCATLATACATLGYATLQATAGNTVYVGAGTYPEIVTVGQALEYRGANAGTSAGTTPGTRGPESIVKGFRNPGNPGTTSIDVTIDGFRIDPQGDAAMIAAGAQPLVWLRGGADVEVANNLFWGGDFVPTCSFTCTTMTDYAFGVQSGTVVFRDNGVHNFRRPVNINQSVGAPATNAQVSRNDFTGITSRAIALSGSTGVQMPGALVDDNSIDATGRAPSSTPGGIIVSQANNVITGNTFTGLSSGVYIDLCKKFSTDGNSITGNVFDGNGGGVNINVNTDGGQCVSSTTEGSGGWVTGGGRINGLEVTGNQFLGNTSYAIRHAAYNWDFWNATAPAISSGPIDVSCNWWSSASGPAAIDVHSDYTVPITPVPDQLIYAAAPHPVFDHTPWRTAPGGPCDGV